MWVNLVLALINALGGLMNWMNAKKMMDAGAEREIAKQLAAILVMTQEGKRILHEMEAKSDEELDSWLTSLGR